MGPHFNECGNLEGRPGDERGFIQLQWGRTSMSAETSCVTSSSAPFFLLQWGRTSMSAETIAQKYMQSDMVKLQWGRTSMSAETSFLPSLLLAVLDASMGPHFNECGNDMK